MTKSTLHTLKQKILSIIMAVALVAAAFPIGVAHASPGNNDENLNGVWENEEVIVVYDAPSDDEEAYVDEYGMRALSDESANLDGVEASPNEEELYEEVQDLIEELDGEEEVLAESFFDLGQAVKVTLPDQVTAEEFIEQAEQMEGVQYVQKNYTYSLIAPVEMTIDDPDAGEYEEATEPQEATEAHEATEPQEATEAQEATEPQEATEAHEALAASEEDELGALASTNDTYTNPAQGDFYQYYLRNWAGSLRGANVFAAWDQVKTQGKVTVAVLDTGMLMTHEDLQSNLVDSKYVMDVYHNKKGSVTDYNGHGTHVSGIIAGVANNGRGVAGVSYNAKILPIKVFDDRADNPKSSTALLIKAYSHLSSLPKSLNLKVINMSLGSSGPMSNDDRILKSAIGKMRNDLGVLTVCAGGNGDKQGNPITANSWPSDYEECVAVTSLGKDGCNSYWSDYNKAKDISAPGENISSTWTNVSGYAKNRVYSYISGTSMAAPIVASTAALLWAYRPSLSPNEVVQAMQKSANKVNVAKNDRKDKSGSAGAVDALKAINYVKSGQLTNSGTDIAKCTIANIATQTLVNGAAKPKLSISYKGVALKEGKDYSVEYLITAGSGTAYATAKGMGSYYGLKRVSFPVRSVTWTRLEGSDRYKTMGKIVQTGFQPAATNTVIIATGENYPDALSASALAGLKNAPILLTPKAFLAAETKREIQRLKPKEVLIIGSEAAVSSSVEKSVKAMGVSPKRIKGATRIETAIEIYKEGARSSKKWGNTAIIASSQGFADALSISSLAYSKGFPIFLTDAKKTLTKDAVSALKSGRFTSIIIVGSEAVVAKSVVSQLSKIGISSKNVTRLGGSDRYQTSLIIAEYAAKHGLSADKMAVATGTNFPDALSGAALCGKNKAVILLVADNDSIRKHMQTFISKNRTSLKSGYVLGSKVVVSNSLLAYLRKISA